MQQRQDIFIQAVGILLVKEGFMRFGINVNVVETMVAAGMGLVLSNYLQDERDASLTETTIHTFAAIGSYVVAKGLYSLATGVREFVNPSTSDQNVDTTERRHFKAQ